MNKLNIRNQTQIQLIIESTRCEIAQIESDRDEISQRV